jgi:hypothetical protein
MNEKMCSFSISFSTMLEDAAAATTDAAAAGTDAPKEEAAPKDAKEFKEAEFGLAPNEVQH